MPAARELETISVPASTKFPIELEVPPGFVLDDPATWPRVEGRMEYVGGRLLWMPPCGVSQAVTAVSAVGVVRDWGRGHREFVIGGNEAGMVLGEDARGAEVTVWRRADVDTHSTHYAHAAPILAVEVEGQEEKEPELREKARWYLGRGVQVVWLVLPSARAVVVVTPSGETRHQPGERLPETSELPGLAPAVDEFFEQLD